MIIQLEFKLFHSVDKDKISLIKKINLIKTFN